MPLSVTAAMMVTADVAAVLVALLVSILLRFGRTTTAISTDLGLPLSAGYLIFFIASLVVIGRREGLYGSLQTQSLWHELRRTLETCCAAGLLLCGGMYAIHDDSVSRVLVAYLLLFSTAFLCLLRGVWRYSLYRSYRHGLNTRNVLIVGESSVGRILGKRMIESARFGRRFVGFLKSSSVASGSADLASTFGGLDDLSRAVRQSFVDEIIIADRYPAASIIKLVEQARELGVEVFVVPGFYDELTPDAPIEYLADFPVIALHRAGSKAASHTIKRIWDFIVSALLLFLLLPTLVLVALAIKLDSPGPVLYASDRIGRKGRVFRCFKFRTMIVNAEAMKDSLRAENERDSILFKIKDDPRVTRIGRLLRKFSLDEIPQLFNVLRGEMSLVGPRPPIASEVEQYETEHFRRLEVLPGLTGLWQVKARQDPSFERYVSLDLTYVENWSFWLDLKILVRTAEVVLRGTGS